VAKIDRSHELRSSQVENPNIGYSKSRGREVAREGQPLDSEHKRTVGSARGIVSRDLARKVREFGCGYREVAR
jgi:hypothetical protein